MGPTAWIMYLQGRSWAEVSLAEPVGQPLRVRHSVGSEGLDWLLGEGFVV